MGAAGRYRIEPGTLALCVGYRQKNWPVVMSALRYIYPERVEIWKAINSRAQNEIDWGMLGDDERDFVENLLKIGDV